MRSLNKPLRAALLALLLTVPAHAQDAGVPDLADLLRGSAGTAASPERRVPFGQAEMQLSFAPVVRKVAPGVVNVYAREAARARSPFADDPFFREFFGNAAPPRARSSLGSGVLVDPAGWVVTNFHVIRGADEIKVAAADGREFEAAVRLKDESLDLAILKIEAPAPLPVVAMGDSDALQVGDLVLALGDPFGVGQTTTSGIVSGLARTTVRQGDFSFMIQTDAAINPGNSGGALVDMSGRLVGINTAIYSRSGGSIGIGFAIPSNIVKAVSAAAIRGESVFERPFVGASFEPVTPQVAEALGLDHPQGALVSAVAPDGPAAKAGLRPGDAVLEMNGVAVEHVDALGYRLATQAIGAKAELTILSQNARRTVSVTLERPPEGLAAGEVAIGGKSPFAGLKVASLSPGLARKLDLNGEKEGVAVTEVAPGSPAEEVGFQPADILREVNGRVIASAQDLREATRRDTRRWRVTLERGGRILRQRLVY